MVVDAVEQRGDPSRGKTRQQVVLEVVAVALQRARVPLAGEDLRLEAGKPATGDGVEAQPRRGGHPARLQRDDQLLAGASGFPQVTVAGAEVKSSGVAGADCVLAVRLTVDAALDSCAAGFDGVRHRYLLSGAFPGRKLTCR